ncbi:P-loop containing nucleoside triphosphate hydrolase protein [Neohortaea acidophila]|uniref:Ribosome-releasing factor 2, mitochondrial n=1 Tax=Neohortaea acidophila TaxID=245834 RepID=A0A6A6PR31_9PEZI|nr:P-loop containing nucleoside triphosphate hydrolase protein [Neohortaea acidophila]KAF2481667.1 P-loop containing nucleoside triphosphate hydrolase protein [Neohortaea acidophila]
MLYYSGFTRRIGADVDEGSTVTDFLPAERARGITIQSAAITFSWPPTAQSTQPSPLDASLPASAHPHNINLIDTPGHADFTFEVLRSLRVLDGAVCILDGVAGVEAQTEKVWAQASAYAIPRIIYVNKLDRDGAAFARTIKEIGARLGVWPAICGIPWWDAEGRLQGVGDVVGLRALKYAAGGDGKDIEVFNLPQLDAHDSALAAELKQARMALVELLSEHDDQLVEKYLEADDDALAIAPQDITSSLRRCIVEQSQRIVPVFAGASFRNVGVQPLLDAVVDLLPNPGERPDAEISYGPGLKARLSDVLAGKIKTASPAGGKSKSLSKEKATFSLQRFEACAIAFKVVADAKRGVLVYVRVYSGAVNRNAVLWNTNLRMAERAQRLMRMYANEAVEIDSISAGQIGVIPGLKATRTGDTLISYAGLNPKSGLPEPLGSLQLRPIDVPPPVFFVSVEPSSLAEEKQVQESLAILLREDPSLHISTDEESGQTHLSGMGELHLEIARDRLVNDLKAKARIGSIEIGYREAITAEGEQVTETYDREIGGKGSKAACTAAVSPMHDATETPEGHDQVMHLPDNNRLTIATPTLHPDGSPIDSTQPSLPPHLELPEILQALRNGVSAALARGPVHGYALHSVAVDLTFNPATHIFPNTTLAALSSAARSAVQTALRQSSGTAATILMEPVMCVTISVDESSMGAVVHDLSSSRGGSVVSLGAEEEATTSTAIDVSKIYTPPDPFGSVGAADLGVAGRNPMRQVVARVPLKEMVGYLKHLRSLTGGRGTFTMVVDRFEKMGAQRQRVVLNELRGDYA